MADIALSSGSICRPFRSPWGAFPTRTMPIISTTPRVDVGRVMTLNYTGSTDAGSITPSTADNTFYTVGIAASSQTGFASSVNILQNMPVWEANPLVEFRAATKGATLASSHVGLRKKLVWDSTLAISWIDLTASTATDWRVVVTGLIDNVGDSGGAVSFRFIDRLGEQVNSTILSSTPLLAFFS